MSLHIYEYLWIERSLNNHLDIDTSIFFFMIFAFSIMHKKVVSSFLLKYPTLSYQELGFHLFS